MTNAEKLWNAFVSVSTVLPSDDLENFGRALYFGTAFKSLGKGARKTVEALAFKIGPTTNASQVYFSLAEQSWGYSDLNQIAEGLDKRVILRELSHGNQNRIAIAASKITWPAAPVTPKPVLSPLTKQPRDPFASDPPENASDNKRVASPAPILGLVAFLSVMGISLLMKKGGI
jgi:hypothetical protein